MNLKLSNGREVYANGGIIGLDEQMRLFEGYDGAINYPAPDWLSETEVDEISRYLTSSEAVELADIMIARWQAFREKAWGARS